MQTAEQEHRTLINPGQKFSLFRLCQRFAGTEEKRLFLLSHILNREVKSIGNVFLDEWRAIRDSAFPGWSDNNWEVSREFIYSAKDLVRQYEEEVLGQGVLFEVSSGEMNGRSKGFRR